MAGDRLLKEGDIVNIDVTFIVEGWYGDSSRMYAVGPVARKAERLIEVTYEAMMRGIAAVRPGATTGDIGHAIQSFVEPQGMSVVRDFCGHGLRRILHDRPDIMHTGLPGGSVSGEGCWGRLHGAGGVPGRSRTPRPFDFIGTAVESWIVRLRGR